MGKQQSAEVERNKKMSELRGRGLSYQAIGNLFNVSKARVHQIISGYESVANRPKFRQEIFENIKKRDNYQCQWKNRCRGKEIAKNKLLVHHIDFNYQNNVPGNLITVCNLCHLYFHREHQVALDKSKA